jgi:hypothetical protein
MREHQEDHYASLDTVLPVFCVASPLGRFADTFAFSVSAR